MTCLARLQMPLVVSQDFEGLKKTSDAVQALKAIGAYSDVAKVLCRSVVVSQGCPLSAKPTRLASSPSLLSCINSICSTTCQYFSPCRLHVVVMRSGRCLYQDPHGSGQDAQPPSCPAPRPVGGTCVSPLVLCTLGLRDSSLSCRVPVLVTVVFFLLLLSHDVL